MSFDNHMSGKEREIKDNVLKISGTETNTCSWLYRY